MCGRSTEVSSPAMTCFCFYNFFLEDFCNKIMCMFWKVSSVDYTGMWNFEFFFKTYRVILYLQPVSSDIIFRGIETVLVQNFSTAVLLSLTVWFSSLNYLVLIDVKIPLNLYIMATWNISVKCMQVLLFTLFFFFYWKKKNKNFVRWLFPF